MAIQVNGTTVIDDSRALSNVTGLKTINGTSVLGSGDITAGATAEPASGGWGGWTTKTQLAYYSGTSFTYTIPSSGWYRIESLYQGNASGSGGVYYGTSATVSWFRAGSRADRAYTLMDVGTSLSGEWYYNSGNRYYWVFYIEAGETITHNQSYSTRIYSHT